MIRLELCGDWVEKACPKPSCMPWVAIPPQRHSHNASVLLLIRRYDLTATMTTSPRTPRTLPQPGRVAYDPSAGMDFVASKASLEALGAIKKRFEEAVPRRLAKRGKIHKYAGVVLWLAAQKCQE